ncbi:MAG TPA: AAA family ATPase, partial [Rhizomicrobium sp.]|nr:AAA family ATPase [Rhizomicrobium sp.]
IELALARSLDNLNAAARLRGPVFFDRGILDAYNHFLQNGLPVPSHFADAITQRRYHRQVILFPPWQEIFGNDAERRHTFESAVAEYESLISTCKQLGYEAVIVPILSVAKRADFILAKLA